MQFAKLWDLPFITRNSIKSDSIKLSFWIGKWFAYNDPLSQVNKVEYQVIQLRLLTTFASNKVLMSVDGVLNPKPAFLNFGEEFSCLNNTREKTDTTQLPIYSLTISCATTQGDILIRSKENSPIVLFVLVCWQLGGKTGGFGASGKGPAGWHDIFGSALCGT